MTPYRPSASRWVQSFADWLTPRRLRMHAVALAVCLWSVCAVDFLRPGVFDLAANIKFQDFLSFYVSGEFVAHGRSADLYNEPARRREMLSIAHPIIARPIEVARGTVFPPTAQTPSDVRLPNLYGPQVALLFAPLSHLPFLMAAEIWVALSLIAYFICIRVVAKSAPALSKHSNLAIYALAFPPLFHFFVRGQLSVLVLVCFTVAFVAFRANRPFAAGIALGFLVCKPQFLVAIPLILVLSRTWRPLAALITSAAAQLAFARLYFGAGVMQTYLDTLWHIDRAIGEVELSLAPIQMHSLRAFWTLLIPQSQIALTLYVLTSIIAVAMAAIVWKSTAPLATRFSALTLAAVLSSPHLFVYDLLVLAPVFILLADWCLANPARSAVFKPALYLAFALPLVGPLSRWTHLQLSVVALAWLLWLLWSNSRELASSESRVV